MYEQARICYERKVSIQVSFITDPRLLVHFQGEVFFVPSLLKLHQMLLVVFLGLSSSSRTWRDMIRWHPVWPRFVVKEVVQFPVASTTPTSPLALASHDPCCVGLWIWTPGWVPN